MTDKWIYWFEELTKASRELVGNKCANLGEMTRSGLPVPPGFALTVDAYTRFMEETGAAGEVRDYVSSINQQQLVRDERHSRHIREVVERHDLPDDMKLDVSREYGRLCDLVDIADLPVAVRSSGVVSMPGAMESFLNIRGDEQLFKKVVEVWGSSFTHQAVAYRATNDLSIEHFPIGVAVMKVVNAKCSGVAMSVHPNTGDRNKMLIEANWGLGEGVVGGAITPDHFVIDRTTGDIHATISTKAQCVLPNGDGTSWQPVDPELQDCSCVSDEELREIVTLAKRLEEAYGEPQDIE
ncbi:MAG TPA: PEP/pyruvate-binding domain-containing protein, partial [Thermoleophilia bacterium]|nr:PEP/pyruvate-binding domain-containing protein [Thermoleophilia bacterium]